MAGLVPAINVFGIDLLFLDLDAVEKAYGLSVGSDANGPVRDTLGSDSLLRGMTPDGHSGNREFLL